MPELVLARVHKSLRDPRGAIVAAVQGVDLAVEAGELLVLVGPSGCGKSTVLRLIAGLETPDQGTISLGGQALDARAPADRDVAMVFQNYALFPHLTVFDNLAFGLRFRRVPKAELGERVRAAAAMLRLEDVLDRKPAALSGGQRQRVALGRALVRRPKVFLLDEPLSNLDARLREEMRAEIARLHERLGATMLFVTHDQTEAMTLGQRICVLNEGRVMQVGAPLEVYQRPANTFVAGFIGSPGMNLIRGAVRRDPGAMQFQADLGDGAELQVRLDAIALRGKTVHPGQPLLLGVRPEDIELLPAAVADQAATLTGTVEVCEPLGHETIVYLTVGRTGLAVRTGPEAGVAVHAKLGARLRVEMLRWFDAETGAALG